MRLLFPMAILVLGAAIAPVQATPRFSFGASVANRLGDFAASELSHQVKGSLGFSSELGMNKSASIGAIATPEPASFLLVGFALVGASLGMRRMRRGKAGGPA